MPPRKKLVPKSPGRPRRVAGELAQEFVGLKLTTDERRLYEAAAEAAAMPLSQWIREACTEHLRKSRKKE